ncbi:MAG: glycosyltransferase family 4 protein [Chloroflexota bacterium]
MKVGLVIYGSLNSLSGGYLYDRKLVEVLQKHGDEVEIISMPWRNYAYHLSDNFAAGWQKRFQNLDVDILLQDELNHPSLFLINEHIKGIVKYPLISIVHHLRWLEAHPPILRWLYRQVERRYLRSVDGFVCNSQTTLRMIRMLVNEKKPAIVATPGGDALPGGTSRANQNAYSHERPIQFIFVGNWIPRKGLDVLVSALGNLQSFNWCLMMVGRTDLNPSYQRKILKLIKRSGLSGRITIYGPLPDEQLVKVWQKADVLIVPSQYEGFGIVYLEAMRFGVIPVAGSNGAAGEIIQSGVNGFLVDPESPHELSVILKNLLEEPQKIPALKQAARKRYAQFPGWVESMSKVRSFLIHEFLS